MLIKNTAFCLCSLVLAFMLARFGFERAALPAAVIETYSTPQSAELFDPVDIPDFGEVSVLDMVDYYMESPPPVSTSSEQTKKVRFQGC